jgi:hypothetical protein
MFTETLPSNERRNRTYLIFAWEGQEGYTYRRTDRCEGFRKLAFEMDSGGMIYLPSFMKKSSGIQKLIGAFTECMEITYPDFYFLRMEKVG